jgi:sporulation protein YlmC with PRC-barrel domain
MLKNDHWLVLTESLFESRVITNKGEHLGNLKDLSINENGEIAGYALKRMDTSKNICYEGKANYIPSIATHSISADLVIINSRYLSWLIN